MGYFKSIRRTLLLTFFAADSILLEKLTVAHKEKIHFLCNFCFSQAMYREEHMFGVFPVELNDVIVGITMLIASLIQVGQCVVYDVCITI